MKTRKTNLSGSVRRELIGEKRQKNKSYAQDRGKHAKRSFAYRVR